MNLRRLIKKLEKPFIISQDDVLVIQAKEELSYDSWHQIAQEMKKMQLKTLLLDYRLEIAGVITDHEFGPGGHGRN